MQNNSPSALAWAASGSPTPNYPVVPVDTRCATCGDDVNAGIHIKQIETPTTANHADYFRFGSQHVCSACAWLYAAGKGRPGNYIAYGDTLEYTVISLESVVTDKRPWLHVLRDLAELPGDTPIAGVMTTDVKPRLWPRVKLATVGNFGLYVHAPDYDLSAFVVFDLRACLDLIALMIDPLKAGFAKASLYHSLLRDYARSRKNINQALQWENAMQPHRNQPHFIPALIAAGITQEDKRCQILTN